MKEDLAYASQAQRQRRRRSRRVRPYKSPLSSTSANNNNDNTDKTEPAKLFVPDLETRVPGDSEMMAQKTTAGRNAANLAMETFLRQPLLFFTFWDDNTGAHITLETVATLAVLETKPHFLPYLLFCLCNAYREKRFLNFFCRAFRHSRSQNTFGALRKALKDTAERQVSVSVYAAGLHHVDLWPLGFMISTLVVSTPTLARLRSFVKVDGKLMSGDWLCEAVADIVEIIAQMNQMPSPSEYVFAAKKLQVGYNFWPPGDGLMLPSTYTREDRDLVDAFVASYIGTPFEKQKPRAWHNEMHYSCLNLPTYAESSLCPHHSQCQLATSDDDDGSSSDSSKDSSEAEVEVVHQATTAVDDNDNDNDNDGVQQALTRYANQRVLDSLPSTEEQPSWCRTVLDFVVCCVMAVVCVYFILSVPELLVPLNV